MTSGLILRDARPEDAKPCAAILNAEIADSTATWRCEPLSEADMADWLGERAGKGRCALVVESPRSVIGFGGFAQFRNGGGYRWTVEHSIYVARAAQGRGAGALMMEALLARGRAEGLRVMVAGIGSENAGSIAFHRRFGFEETARMPSVGWKFGRALDLVLMQKALG